MAAPFDSVFDPIEALDRIAASRCGVAMKRALLCALEGEGYRLAARRAGFRESRAKDVFRNACRLGFAELHKRRQRQRRAECEAAFQAAMAAQVERIRAEQERAAEEWVRSASNAELLRAVRRV